MKPDVAINEFLQRILDDREKSVHRSAAEYAAFWPEHAELIEAEYLRLFEGADEHKAAPLPSEVPEAWRVIGDYETRRVLGQGGQGIVLEAWDRKMQRRVALKVLTGLQSLSPQALERFRRETILASRLDDASVCTVYGTGEHAGQPYIVMQFVEGRTLAELLQRSRDRVTRQGDDDNSSVTLAGMLDGHDDTLELEEEESSRSSEGQRRTELRRVVAMIEQAARALHKAHEAGVIHRDVKPANVMITPSGRPVLLDFGLARAEEPEASLVTQSGDVLGTPPYMSPEQLSGEGDPVTRRSDVYSLGATLFECLTLRRPFEQPTPEMLYAAIRTQTAPSPRRFNPFVPRDLAVVVETALNKAPERRYATAGEFAEDLRRTLNHEPIHARPAGPGLRLWMWAKRRPSVAVLSSLLFVTLVIAGFWLLHFVNALDGKRIEAKERGEDLRWQAYRADVAAALGRLQLGDVAGGRRFLDGAPGDLRGWEWRHGQALVDMSLRTMKVHQSRGHAFPIETKPGQLISLGRDHPDAPLQVRYWDIETGNCLHEIEGIPRGLLHPGPRGDLLLFIFQQGKALTLVDGRDGKHLWTCKVNNVQASMRSPSFSPDGKRIVMGTSRALITIDVADGTIRTTPIEGVVFAPEFIDNDRAIARVQRGARSEAAIMDVSTGTILSTLPSVDPATTLSRLRLSLDRRLVYASWRSADDSAAQVNRTGKVRRLQTVTEIASGREVCRFESESSAFEWLPERGTVMIGRRDGSIRIVEPRRTREMGVLLGHTAQVRSIFSVLGGRRIVTSSTDGHVRIWSPDMGSLPFRAAPWVSDVSSVSPRGRLVASGHWGSVTLFDTDTGWPLWRKNLSRSSIKGLSFSPDEKRLVVVDAAGSMFVMNSKSGVVMHGIQGPQVLSSPTWSPDGHTFALGTGAGRVIEYSPTLESLKTIQVAEGPISRISYADRREIWAVAEGELHLIRMDSGQTTRIEGIQQVTALTRGSKKGEMILGQADGSIVVHEVENGRFLRRFAEIAARVSNLRFVGEGRRLAVSSRQSIYLHDTTTGDPVFDFAGASFFIRDVGYRSDSGALIVAGSEHVFTSFESGPPVNGYEHRETVRRAWAKLGPLYDELASSEDVVAAVKEMKNIDPKVREVALDMAGRLGDSANELNTYAWSIVAYENSEREACLRALRCARRACEINPESAAILNTLATAQYRCGLWAEAEATLNQVLEKRDPANAQPLDLAVRAMARMKLGDRDGALEDLNEARAGANLVKHRSDWELRAFIAEAERLIEERP